jgi:co-chaperonin GroES (HSP10)
MARDKRENDSHRKGHAVNPKPYKMPPIPPGAAILNPQDDERGKVQEAYFNMQADPAEPGKTGFQPIGDQVAVRVHKVEKTNTGIELAGNASDSLRTPTGDVLEVGPDCKQVKPGDVVFVRPSEPATPLMWEHGRFVVIKEQQIIGIKRERPAPTPTPAPVETPSASDTEPATDPA